MQTVLLDYFEQTVDGMYRVIEELNAALAVKDFSDRTMSIKRLITLAATVQRLQGEVISLGIMS